MCTGDRQDRRLFEPEIRGPKDGVFCAMGEEQGWVEKKRLGLVMIRDVCCDGAVAVTAVPTMHEPTTGSGTIS